MSNIYLSDSDKKLLLSALYHVLEYARNEEIEQIKSLYKIIEQSNSIQVR